MRIIPEKKKEEVSFSEKVASLTGKHQRQILIDRQRKVKRTVLHFGFIDAPIFLIILMAAFWDDEELRMNFIVAILGLMVVAIIFVVFYEIKKSFDDYAKTAVPALVVFCWIFLYLPFSGIIPVSLMYLSVDKEELVFYERMVNF